MIEGNGKKRQKMQRNIQNGCVVVARCPNSKLQTIKIVDCSLSWVPNLA